MPKSPCDGRMRVARGCSLKMSIETTVSTSSPLSAAHSMRATYDHLVVTRTGPPARRSQVLTSVHPAYRGSLALLSLVRISTIRDIAAEVARPFAPAIGVRDCMWYSLQYPLQFAPDKSGLIRDIEGE